VGEEEGEDGGHGAGEEARYKAEEDEGLAKDGGYMLRMTLHFEGRCSSESAMISLGLLHL
jgi:hypothetical protein